MNPPEGVFAIPMDEVLDRLMKAFAKDTQPNPGLAPVFGTLETPASMTLMTCTDDVHAAHAYIDVAGDEGHSPIFCSQEHDGSWEINNELTLSNNLGNVFNLPPGYGISVQGVIGDPAGMPIYSPPSKKKEEDDKDLPGFYL